MKAIVVYSSHWGNTAAIGKAIAEGIGSDAEALTTSEAVGDKLSQVDLLVVGSPVLGFSLPTDTMIQSLASNPKAYIHEPDLSHPSLRSWLDSLPPGTAFSAAFETRIWWSPGSATAAIERKLKAGGYRRLAEAHRFIVEGREGPLKNGEVERAKQWGIELAQAMRQNRN
jgi:hypothetical protein